MNLIKPTIVNGGGSAIELADNLSTTVSGKALDARQGHVLNDIIHSDFLNKTEINNLYASKNDLKNYIKTDSTKTILYDNKTFTFDDYVKLTMGLLPNSTVTLTKALESDTRYIIRIRQAHPAMHLLGINFIDSAIQGYFSYSSDYSEKALGDTSMILTNALEITLHIYCRRLYTSGNSIGSFFAYNIR